ncbi:MAG: SIR2 family protein [Acidobacteriaceae bacterium]|nr:SIR2 family protein [Acidobacteriaceae bacterium]
MDIPATLTEAIKQKQAILFAGAGLSSSLGLPLFDVLTAHLAQELGLEDEAHIDFPILAEYYLLQKSSHEEFFEWMRCTWHPHNVQISSSRPHNDILDLDFPVIYTTNYDCWIERSFEQRGKAYRKVVSVQDLADVKPGETEIIKFHGDLDDPASIILTESNFLRRMSLDEPLDIRLRSDSLARPILFVGYSLSDPNIRYLLYKLRQLWAQHTDEGRKPASYILMVERNPIQERLLCERGVQPIVSDAPDATAGLCEFFQALRHAVE